MTPTTQLSSRLARARGNPRGGQAMIEFSLVFILFMIMLVGMFEFGRAVWIYTTVAHAAAQGARYAIVHGENNPVADSDIITKVKRQAVGLNGATIQVTPTWEDGGKAVGSFVRVRVLYPFQLVAGPLIFGSSGFNIGSTSRMVVLN